MYLYLADKLMLFRTSKMLIIAVVFLSVNLQMIRASPMGRDGMFPELFMNSQMANSVPRMGRRSMSPFMQATSGGSSDSTANAGGFGFLKGRPRRRIGSSNPFGGGMSGFRFAAGPGFYQVNGILIFIMVVLNQLLSHRM